MTTMQTATTAKKGYSNWLNWFKGRESSIFIDKANQGKLQSTFDSTVAAPTLLEAVLKHDEIVFLQKVQLGARKVALFHNLVEVGGTIYDTEGSKEYGFIQGVGEGLVGIMTPDVNGITSVESDTAQRVPTMTNLIGVKSVNDVDALTTSATVTSKPRNFVPVPPFLLDTVHTAITTAQGDARNILLHCVKAVKAFDTDHADDEEYKDKAQTKSKAFLYWLYLVSQDNNAIKAIVTIGCSNAKVMEALQYKIRAKLTSPHEGGEQDTSEITKQVESTLKRPFEVLAATSSSTSEFMEKLTQLHSQSNDKTTKNFAKIPRKYQQMLLVASSVSEVTEVDYNAEAKEFFKSSTSLNAQVMINSILEAENIDCSVSPAVAATLAYGSFLWKNAFSPSGFASSVLTSEGIMRGDTLQEGMVLDYATKFDMTAASLSKLTKTQVLYPTTVEDLTHRMKAFQCLASFFFKRHGYLSQGLLKVVKFCVANRMLIRTRIYIDKAFIAKFMCAIDDRVYQWLKQCSTHEMVTDTDITLVEFSPLLQDIQLNRFQYVLPPSIAKLNTRDEQSYSDVRRGMRIEGEKIETVQNEKVVTQWKMRPNEVWNTMFRNKAIEGPLLSMRCHPCLKYQVRGFCFVDCRNRASHCLLTGSDKEKVNSFLKGIRGE